MMANFDELKQKAKETVQTIADKSIEFYKIAEEKTKVLAKITKLSAEMTFEKGNVRKLYRELGKLYYDLYKNAPEPGFQQACEEITASLAVIAEKKREIDALKGVGDDETDKEESGEKDDVEIIVEDFEESAPGSSLDSMKSAQDTDSLEEPEGDIVLDRTPPAAL
jgi:hypothetical protein